MTEIEPNRLLGAVALLALAPAAATFTPPPEQGRIGISTPAERPGWFLCDAIDQPFAALVGTAQPGGAIDITLVSKARPAHVETMRYTLGAPSPGAGQVYYPLTLNGRDAGNLHQFNPATYADVAAVRTPTFTSVKLGGRQLSCRWLAGTRFAGVTASRSLVVTQGPEGLSLRSFTYGSATPVLRPDGAQQTNAASVSIDQGEESTDTRGGVQLRFENGDDSYTIAVPASGPATLALSHRGAAISREPLLGFVFTPQEVAPPQPVVRLASGGWPRLSQTDVWTDYSPYYCTDQANEACLVKQMSDSGATKPSLAFTRRLLAAQKPGYVSSWDQEGPVGVATVTYPWRLPGAGVWFVPVGGPPLEADAYELTASDRRRPDAAAVLRQFPTAYIADGGSTLTVPQALPGGGQRIIWKSYLTVCDDCQPQGTISVGYDFDRDGHFVRAGVVEAK